MAAHSKKVVVHGGGSDSVYGLGMIGAWVYYIGRATTPRLRVLGFFKGLVWPAMLVYEVLKFFNEELPATRRLAPAQPAPTLTASASPGEQTCSDAQGSFRAQAGARRQTQNEEGCPKIGLVIASGNPLSAASAPQSPLGDKRMWG